MNEGNPMIINDGLIPQTRSPTKCLWIEKSIKEGKGPIRTVKASGKKNPFLSIKTYQSLNLRASLESVYNIHVMMELDYLISEQEHVATAVMCYDIIC
jgi:hypothetical protein